MLIWFSKGQWRSNFANGPGSLSYADGDKYVGHWKNGKKYGTGELYYTNGDKFRLFILYSFILLMMFQFFYRSI